MSVRKYRVYLLIVVIVAVLAGGLVYFYNEKQEKSFENGTLVQNVYLTGEELV